MKTIRALLGTHLNEISNNSPLGWLLYGDNANIKQVADHTDYCARSILKQNPQWIKSQFSKIAKEQEPENVSAMLGEVRAYGDLIKV